MYQHFVLGLFFISCQKRVTFGQFFKKKFLHNIFSSNWNWIRMYYISFFTQRLDFLTIYIVNI